MNNKVDGSSLQELLRYTNSLLESSGKKKDSPGTTREELKEDQNFFQSNQEKKTSPAMAREQIKEYTNSFIAKLSDKKTSPAPAREELKEGLNSFSEQLSGKKDSPTMTKEELEEYINTSIEGLRGKKSVESVSDGKNTQTDKNMSSGSSMARSGVDSSSLSPSGNAHKSGNNTATSNNPSAEGNDLESTFWSVVTETKDPNELWKENLSSGELTINFPKDEKAAWKLLLKLPSYDKVASINHLTLDFSACDFVDDVVVCSIYRSLSNTFLKLKTFTYIEPRPSSRVTDKGYNFLAKGLSEQQSLTELSLKLSSLRMYDMSIANLAESIKEISGLQKVEIDVSSVMALDNKIFEDFALILNHHQSLTELSFSWHGEHLESSKHPFQGGINCLIKNLKQLVNLKKLKLEFISAKLSKENLSNFADTLEQLKQLTSLHLNFQDISLYDSESCEKIANSISGLKNLKEFNLPSVDSFFVENTKYFVEVISRLPLSKLSLNFSKHTLMKYKDWDYIAQMLAKLVNLTELKLELSSTGLNDHALIQFSLALQGLTKLNSLNLDLTSNKQLLFSGSRALATAISQLSELKRCSINLTDCPEIHMAGIYLVTLSICKLNSITELKLVLDDLPITDESLKRLATALSFLKSKPISTLDLSVSKRNDISREGVEYLATTLLNELSELKKFSLGIPTTGNINWEDLKESEKLNLLNTIKHQALSKLAGNDQEKTTFYVGI